MVVRELFAKIGLSTNAQDFAKAELLVEGIKKGLEIIREKAHEAFEGFVEVFKGTAEFSEHLSNMSAATGLSTTSLQELRYAAGLADIGLDEMVQSVEFLGINMAKAADGGSEVGQAFKRLGVSVTDGNGKLKDVGATFDEVINKMQQMPDGARKMEIAQEIFGRSGKRMLPLLKQGAEGMAEIRKEAHELGLILTDEEVEAGDEFGKGMKKIGFALEGLRNQIAGPLMKPLKEMIVSMVEWVKANRVWISQKVHIVVGALGKAFSVAWAIAKGFGSALKWVVDHVYLLGVILGSVVVAAIILHIGQLIAMAFWYGVIGAAMLWTQRQAIQTWLVTAGWLIVVAALLFELYVLAEDLWYSVTTGEGVWADLWHAIWDSDSMWAVRQFFTGIGKWASAAVDSVKVFFSDLWAWLSDGFKRVVAKIPGGQALLDKFSSSTAAPVVTAPSPAGMSSAALPTADLFSGGAVSPGASAAVSAGMSSSSRSLNYSPSISAPITFNIPAGTSPNDIAAYIPRYINETNERQLREAHAAVSR